MRSALLLVVPLLLAGCASPDGLGFSRGVDLPDPYYKEHRQLMDGEHHEVYEVPVGADARTLNVTATLTWRDHGLALPDVAPARLRVALYEPGGLELGVLELDARREAASLLIAPEHGAGKYLVRVDGFGASHALDERSYGAEYTLVAEVLYAE